ncbi:MAG: hypothetical protein RRA92_05735 [Gemmatimonadota bacterium]|nr:hypothetical protein [Gemmatimonadota bacterium]
MSAARRVAAAIVALAAVAGLGFLSRAPLPAADPGEAALRLSWRLRGEEAGECRFPTAAELEDLPPHMRNPDACAVVVPPYRLTAEVDGRPLVDARVEARGAHGDRPLFVYRDLRLPAGTHAVRIRFAPDGGPDGGPDEGDADGRSGDEEDTAPLVLHIEETLTLGPGDVLLVTRHPDTGALEVRRPRG